MPPPGCSGAELPALHCLLTFPWYCYSMDLGKRGGLDCGLDCGLAVEGLETRDADLKHVRWSYFTRLTVQCSFCSSSETSVMPGPADTASKPCWYSVSFLMIQLYFVCICSSMDLGKRCGLDGGLPVRLYVQQRFCPRALRTFPWYCSSMDLGKRGWSYFTRLTLRASGERRVFEELNRILFLHGSRQTRRISSPGTHREMPWLPQGVAVGP